MDKIKIMSYNSTGMASDRIDFIKQVVINNYAPDIIMLQETWLIESRLNVLGSIDTCYLANGVPAVIENDLMTGRPKCGLGILWNKSLCKCVSFREIDNTNRACAIEVQFENSCFVIINVYMPVDNYSKTRVSDEFQDTLDAIELFVQKCAGKQIIIGGDANIDFTRQNAHDKVFLDFLERNSCVHVYNLPNCNVNFTYNDPNNDSFSCIDHFSVSNTVCQAIESVFACKEPLNPSYHLPVCMTMLCRTDRATLDDLSNGNNHVPIAWHKVCDDDLYEYQEKQQQFIGSMINYDVSRCVDVTCEHIDHRNQLDLWCRDLIKCCLLSDFVLPRVKAKKCKRPNWNADVKPYREDCVFWHKLWINAGCPKNGVLYDVKKYTKRQYMYANRRNKRREDILRKERMAECIASNADRDFFKEIKRYESKVNTHVCIDNIAKSCDIAERFACKYKELYNSVPSSNENMDYVYTYVNQCSSTTDTDRIVTVNEVYEALKYIKANKSDGDEHFMSNHILLSCHEYLEKLSFLLTAVFTHGYQPFDILKGAIESIPKNARGNVCDSGNYRGITLCNSISKIFDVIILNRYSNMLATSDMQYAFKDKHSTVMCTLVLKEVVRYYSNHSTDVFSCFVDATKAFDRVRYDKLFTLLIDRGLPPIVLRALLDLYERQQLCTRWRGHKSEMFSTTNGIRQGGVISPVLFCVYIDELLLRLERQGIGCCIGKHFYGAIAYADDLTLLSPTISGLNDMLKTCEIFSAEYGVKYNPTKSVCMVFSKKKYDIQGVVLNGDVLKWVDHAKHLGNFLDCDMSECTEIRMKRGDLVYRVNHTLASLGKCNTNVVSKIFNSKCSHFYGAQSWNFEDKNVAYFQTMWNRCIRRILNLPNTTHRRYLPLLNGTCSALEQIYCRFISMLQIMLFSTNVKVRYISERFVYNCNSIVGANLNIIAKLLCCERSFILSQSKSQLKNMFLVKYDESMPVVSQILEIRSSLEGRMCVAGFLPNELSCIHDYLCTS